METVMELSGDINQLSELKEVIAEHGRECLALVEQIEKEGITDPQVAVNLLLYDEAIRNLTIRRNLFIRMMQGTAIVLLPLPPHLSDPFLGVAKPHRIFSAERNLPPHLKRTYARTLDTIPLAELEALIDGVDSLVLEGYIEHNSIYIRDTAANLIFLLSSKGLRDIYVHSIPHIPPQSRFVELIVRGDVNIVSI